ncbi:RhoGAP domain protein [Cooperia oncophora]
MDAQPADDVEPHALQVPRIVENCTQYLMAYGLNTVGLFRIAGNTKRCRLLKTALEKLNGIPLDERIDVVRLLVSLLGPPNIDTLYVLLKFLHEVSLHCHDHSHTGVEVQGNRMDARNLATIFAPSILRPDHGKLHATLAENEQQIAIVETMIAHVEEVFRIPKELQCNIYNKLRDTDPDRLDRFLNHLSRTESSDHQLMSPFPATAEEGQRNCPSPGSHSNGKDSLSAKVCSQRSGSWPFSLGRSSRQQQFFPADSACPSTSSCPSDENESKEAASSTGHNTDPVSKDLATTPPDRARSPSRERDFRLTARLGAAAARRRLCNVVRAFRFSSVTRSSPNVANF